MLSGLFDLYLQIIMIKKISQNEINTDGTYGKVILSGLLIVFQLTYNLVSL